MNSNLKVDTRAIAAMRSELTKDLVKTSMTAKDLVEHMHDALIAARAKGKTLDQMHQDITKHGVSINLATFRKYASSLLAEREETPPHATAKTALAQTKGQPQLPAKAEGPSGLRSLRSSKQSPGLFD